MTTKAKKATTPPAVTAQEVELRYYTKPKLTLQRAEQLVEELVGWRSDTIPRDDKIKALVELLLGLEDGTGEDLTIANCSLRAVRHAYTFSRNAQNNFTDYVVEHCGGVRKE